MQKVVPNHNLLLMWFILWKAQGAVPFRGLLGIGEREGKGAHVVRDVPRES